MFNIKRNYIDFRLNVRSSLNFLLFSIVAVGVSVFLLFKINDAIEEIDQLSNTPYYKSARESFPAAEISTNGWKTYRNEKYGFEVRYPDTLKAENKLSTSGIESIMFMKTGDKLRVAIRIYSFYPDEYDLSSFANRFIPTLGYGVDALVSGLPAKRFPPSMAWIHSNVTSGDYFTVIFVKGRIGFQFDGVTQDQDALAEKILTTFRFFK